MAIPRLDNWFVRDSNNWLATTVLDNVSENYEFVEKGTNSLATHALDNGSVYHGLVGEIKVSYCL